MKNLTPYILAALVFAGCKNARQKQDDALANAKSSKDSIAIITKELDQGKTNPGLLILRSHIYSRENRLELSIRDAEHAISIDSTKADWYIYLADLYMERPYVKGALLSLERAAELKPDDKNLYLRLGKLFFEVKNRERSFRYLNDALKLDPNLAEAFYWRGYNYREMKDSKNAIKNFERTIELDPKYFDAYLQLGLLYSDQNSPKAEEYYNSALSLKPDDTRALYARGMYYQGIDSTNKAITDYQHILQIDPGNRSANYNLGYNYFNKKDYKKAADYFSKAIEADPNYIAAYIGRGNAFKMLSNKQQADADLKLAAELEKKAKEDSK
jgi:tetratricopeptide (TPR) repeat protein